MKIKDLDFIRDPSMEVYRASVSIGDYTIMVAHSKPDNLYAITIAQTVDSVSRYVNIEGINPGSVITSFLREEECNKRLANFITYVDKQ